MVRQAHITLVNGVETSALDITDRGLAYGDGLFETMRVVRGKVPLLDYHRQRLALGAERLALGVQENILALFDEAVRSSLKGLSRDALLKVIVTRGSAGRGYTPPESADCTVVAQLFEPVDLDQKKAGKGIRLDVLNYRLGPQPALAGIKHLNRLDQVLASRELSSDEGLICDLNGYVVEGVKTNALFFFEDRVVTPDLSSCGVAGTLRQYLLENAKSLGFEIAVESVSESILEEIDGIAMINSIIGCWPVKQLGSRKLGIDKRCRTIQTLLADKLAYPRV